MQRKRIVLLSFAGLVLIVAAVFVLRALRPAFVHQLAEADYLKAEAQFAEMAADKSMLVPAGFAVQAVGEPFAGLSLEEPEGSCRGGGTYLLRAGSANLPLLISAPHRGADRYTGPLAFKLLLEGRAAAAAWNSAPRRGACGGGQSDLARLDRHPFTAFAAGFARAFPQGRVVQIHGFDPDRRETPEGSAAAVILSSGSRSVSAAVRTVAECIRSDLPGDRVAVFPSDVGELGALRNAQGRRLRAIGFEGFVHAELSLNLRQRLMQDPALRRRFAACLEAGL